VIVSRTQPDLDNNTIAYLHKEFPTLKSVLLDSFRQMNGYPSSFHRSFSLPVDYQIVDDTQLDAIFKNGDGWENYYKKYENSPGILRLSRVGFSPDGKQAAFYTSNSCGSRCGAYNFVAMEKVDSNWKVMKEVLIGASRRIVLTSDSPPSSVAAGTTITDRPPRRTVAAGGNWPKSAIALVMEKFNKSGVCQCREAARMVLL
jgi:hypothetical protein